MDKFTKGKVLDSLHSCAFSMHDGERSVLCHACSCCSISLLTSAIFCALHTVQCTELSWPGAMVRATCTLILLGAVLPRPCIRFCKAGAVLVAQ
jgi:hypothetical protein